MIPYLHVKHRCAVSVIDYAVIGGGVAGTYCVWRLKQAYPEKNIILFEFSNRIGGRLLTTKLHGTNENAELGGMRYNPNEHKIFAKLVDELKLESRPFPMGTDDDPQGLNNLAYFRDKHLHISDLDNSDKVPYNVDWSERNKTPDDLQRQVMTTLVPDLKNLMKNPDEWFNVKVFGKYLWEYGFWNLLYEVLSPEAYQFLKYGSGYDTNVSNGNAVLLLPTGLDYSSSNVYLTLVEGMNAFPKALAEQFETIYKGELRKNLRLGSIVRREDNNYNLKFFQTKTENGKTTDIDQKPQDEVAEHVILAMPRAALELIEWDQWKKDEFLKENLDSVLIQGAMKIVLAYDYAWWKSLGLVFGRSITDLPIRQTMYFTSLDDANPKEISKTPGLLLASYNDIETVPFWKGLEKGHSFNGPEEYRASIQMVQEVHKQVMEMHGQLKLPLPYAAAYRDWSEKPYGGGWHAWKAGCNYKNIVDKMCHPVQNEKVYICGEAYSNDQGWAEGALETTELMLTEDLGVSPHKITCDWKPDYLRRLRY